MSLKTANKAMYVQRNIESRTRNHFHHGKAKNITNFEQVIFVLVIQPEIRMRHIIMYRIFLH